MSSRNQLNVGTRPTATPLLGEAAAHKDSWRDKERRSYQRQSDDEDTDGAK